MAISPEELPDYLSKLTRRVNDPAGRAAADAMISAFDSGIKREELTRTVGHPSIPGQPPALESGRLRASFRVHRARPVGAYRWMGSDGPTTVYARIQEYGGDIWAKHTYVDKRTGRTMPGFLRWEGPGGVHFARHVHLPERSYMRTGIKRMRADGTLHRAAIGAFSREMGFL
jgi:hypothetical protein